MNVDGRGSDVAESLRLLALSHATAMRQAEETLSFLCRIFDLPDFDEVSLRRPGSTAPGGGRQPVADRTRFSVRWRDRECFLGNTLLLRFFEAIARRPGRYCSHEELLDEVWHGTRSKETIRHVAKRLRDKLCASGMKDLARAIDSSVPGHYVLRLE